ncbi:MULTISPECIES: hypothetical protein [unclassified Aureimonas]|uniref:hypothetical protein n=1 Tax=unclassified Aureimonas TaxID=2615206 RepID=UPI0012E38330|nr:MULTISPECIES: hypothetical protein [unclassified Aureimonas]
MWPTAFIFVAPLIFSLSADFSWDLYPPISTASFFLFLVYSLSPIVGLGACAWFLFNLRWKKFFSYAVLPMFFYMQAVYPHVGSADISRYIYFFTRKTTYEEEISASHADKKPQMMWFFWRDASPMFGQILFYIVYDSSDELAKPNALRSAAWSARAQKSYTAAFGYPADTTIPDDADHLFGHYYVVALVW